MRDCLSWNQDTRFSTSRYHIQKHSKCAQIHLSRKCSISKTPKRKGKIHVWTRVSWRRGTIFWIICSMANLLPKRSTQPIFNGKKFIRMVRLRSLVMPKFSKRTRRLFSRPYQNRDWTRFSIIRGTSSGCLPQELKATAQRTSRWTTKMMTMMLQMKKTIFRICTSPLQRSKN